VLSDTVDLLASWIRGARSAVCFTGAGISTESGIPDFRSPGGVWARSQPVQFQDFLESESSRLEYWRQKTESHADMADAAPNIAHRTLADWERRGWVRGVITQNIDGLHQFGGSRQVLELHGTAREVSCLGCGWRDVADRWVAGFADSGQVPACPECQGLVKHATISFGQSLDSDVLREAGQWSQDADLYIVLGSSLVVHPAASLPTLAKQNGARLVIVNREPTPLDALADIVVNESIGAVIHEWSLAADPESNSSE
jgi:NAD-dependent deacetylase